MRKEDKEKLKEKLLKNIDIPMLGLYDINNFDIMCRYFDSEREKYEKELSDYISKGGANITQ